MGGEKLYTEDQLEKIGELRASIQFAEIQKEHLHQYAELQGRSFREETVVGSLCLGGVGILGLVDKA